MSITKAELEIAKILSELELENEASVSEISLEIMDLSTASESREISSVKITMNRKKNRIWGSRE